MEGYLKIKGVNYSYTQHGHIFKYLKVKEVWHKRTDTVGFLLYKISASANLWWQKADVCLSGMVQQKKTWIMNILIILIVMMVSWVQTYIKTYHSVYFVACFLYINIFFKILFIYFWLHCVFVALLRFSLVAASRGCSLLQCMGFSMRWLLLLRITDSRTCRLQLLQLPGSRAQSQYMRHTCFISPRHVEPFQTRDWTCAPCIGKRILYH